MKPSPPAPVILFDGVCNLCSGTVKFVFRRDAGRLFYFAPLQSAAGRRLLDSHGLSDHELESMVLIEDGGAYRKSTAALRIAKKLHRGWPLLYAFIIIPRPIRDAVYDFIGRNRYRWFGRKEVCWLPQGELLQRFLPDEETAGQSPGKE